MRALDVLLTCVIIARRRYSLGIRRWSVQILRKKIQREGNASMQKQMKEFRDKKVPDKVNFYTFFYILYHYQKISGLKTPWAKTLSWILHSLQVCLNFQARKYIVAWKVFIWAFLLADGSCYFHTAPLKKRPRSVGRVSREHQNQEWSVKSFSCHTWCTFP